MFQLDLTVPQTRVFASQAPYVGVVAGYGSGKTFTICVRILSDLIEFPGKDIGYFAPTNPLITTIFYPVIEDLMINSGIAYTIDKKFNIVHVHGLGKIICKSMERPERIVGFNIFRAYVDEMDILPTQKAIESLQKIKARCRQSYGSVVNQVVVGTTPEGFKATYRLFEKEPLEGSELIRMPTASNPHLPQSYVRDLFKMYPAAQREAYLQGKFVNLTSGRVYYTFDRRLHNCKTIILPGDLLHVGVDFNVGRNSALVFVERGIYLDAVDEIHGLYDTPDTIRVMRERYQNHTVICYPDASGHNRSTINASITDHSLLNAAGFVVRVNGVNPSVKDRISNVNRQIESGLLRVNVDRCPEYTSTLEQRAYNAAGLPDKEHELDHLADCGEYVVSYIRPVFRTNASLIRGIRGRY